MITPPKVLAFVLASFLSIATMSLLFEKLLGNQEYIKYFTLQDIVGYESFKKDRLAGNEKIKAEKEKVDFEEKLLATMHTLSDSINVAQQIADLDSTRFWLPNNDRNFWNELFAQWEKLKDNKTLFRILHYGDSQIEMDRITAYIRENLQKQFGGGGPGLLPALQLVPSYSIQQSSSENWKRYVSFGVNNDRVEHNHYGISGTLCRFDSLYANVSISPRNRKKSVHLQKFESAKVIVGRLSSPLTVKISYPRGSNTQTLKPNHSEQMIRWNFDTAQSYFNFGFTGDSTADILGIAIDPQWGIVMDNIPWRGSSGLTFTSISKSSLKKTYHFLSVKMVILQFGGNSVPHLKDEKMIENFVQRFARQIDHIRAIDSTIKVLVIGPSDMSVNEMGEMKTYPLLEKLITRMREVSNQKGAAYWSLYHAMGGYNSMANWVKAQPALGAPDYIHFTQLGAQEIAFILKKAIWREYDIYQKKKRLENHSE
ncbi:MAG: GDSL-type esterase/lipase family protein [Bacteroidia bacterium]|nr:GDSL-type esterase/lipase family protein [Bacteroidia bacterium]